MRKIFISAGHSNKPGRDRGAASGSNIEGVLTAELRTLIVRELKEMGINTQIDSDNSVLSETINFFRNLVTSNSIVLDIHFNSGPSNATGTETLIPATNTDFERRLAGDLSKCVSEVLGIPMRGSHKGIRGVKTELESHHGRLGWMRLTGENVLMEICFISNPSEMVKYHNKKFELSKRIAQVLFFWITGQSHQAENKVFYVVKSGDSLWKIANENGTTVENLKQLNGLTGNAIQVGQRLLVKA